MAWKKCEFCRQDATTIAGILCKGPWGKLPLEYKCAWARICQVGFGRIARKDPALWKELCRTRSEVNHQPRAITRSRRWTERWCPSYDEVDLGHDPAGDHPPGVV